MRTCVICGKAKLGGSYPHDIRVCRACDLIRHRAVPGDLTPEGFVAGSVWRLAATMLDNPHQYTVRDLTTPDGHQTTAMGHAEFEWFARLTLGQGKPQRWGAKTYRYCELDGWEYWTMGFPPEVTTIVNRRAVSREANRILGTQVGQALRSGA